jgi:hypothetical protein
MTDSNNRLHFNKSDLSPATVGYQDTFDGSETEPTVFPSRLPNLLLNGATGIAVGMSTSIPSHNLPELADALCLVAKDPNATAAEVLKVMPAPVRATFQTRLIENVSKVNNGEYCRIFPLAVRCSTMALWETICCQFTKPAAGHSRCVGR